MFDLEQHFFPETGRKLSLEAQKHHSPEKAILIRHYSYQIKFDQMKLQFRKANIDICVHTLTKQSWKCALMKEAASDGAFGMCSLT